MAPGPLIISGAAEGADNPGDDDQLRGGGAR